MLHTPPEQSVFTVCKVYIAIVYTSVLTVANSSTVTSVG